MQHLAVFSGRGRILSAFVGLLVSQLHHAAPHPVRTRHGGVTLSSSGGLPITSVNGSFPMGVWLQAPRLAQRYRDEVGINLFIGGELSEVDLADYRKAGMFFINTQTTFALENALNEPLLYGYNQMDEPDNAQSDPNHPGHYLPCVDPAVLQARYSKWKQADPSRPIFQGLGQGCAYTNYVGRGACRNKTAMYAEYAKGADIVSFDIYPTNAEEPEVKDKLWLPVRQKKLACIRRCSWTLDQLTVCM